MSKDIQEVDSQTFVETALKLGGKSEEEARKTGSLDRADEQVESLYAPRYQTAHSPIHRAVWDQEFPSELFQTRPSVVPADCEKVMPRALDLIRRHRTEKSLLDVNRKISEPVL